MAYIFILPRGPTALYLKGKIVEEHFAPHYNTHEVTLTKTGLDAGIVVRDDETFNEDVTLELTVRREVPTDSSDDDGDLAEVLNSQAEEEEKRRKKNGATFMVAETVLCWSLKSPSLLMLSTNLSEAVSC